MKSVRIPAIFFLVSRNFWRKSAHVDLISASLNYCWFMTLYVGMGSSDDEIAYAVEGEGEWGENIGFVISNDSVAYVGADYLDYMENAQ
nr:hypothetical protein [uncultured Oscillibacter sp.]